MVDILNSIVLPDLKIFEKYIEGVIEIPYDNAEKQRKALDLRERIKKYRARLSNYEGRDEKQGSLINHMGKKILPPITSQSDQKKILRDSSEYWDYLNSGKSWNVNQDGLLYFIIDCFYEIEVRNWHIDENLKEVLSNIRTSLTKMNELLLKIEEEINRDEPTMRLTKYTVLINECIDRLPDKKVQRLGKGLHIQSDGRAYYLMQDNTKYDDEKVTEQGKEGEEQILDPVNIVLKKIKSFIMKRKMTLEEFMALFRSVEDKIPVEEFRNKLKTFLGTIVKLNEIEEFITSIRKSKKDSNDLDNTVSINKVYRKLQKSFERDRAVNFKEMMKKEEQGTMLEDLSSPNSLNIFRAMRNFIDYYVEFTLSNEEANNELRDVITDLFNSSKKMSQKKIDNFSKVLNSLIKTFKKKRYELYLLRMLKYILKHLESHVGNKKKVSTEPTTNDSDSEEEDEDLPTFEEMEEFKHIQLIFAQSDALDLCLSNIREGVSRDLVFEAVELLNLFLKGGNKSVQQHILETLKESKLTSGYFNFIKLKLWDTVDSFKKLKESDETTKSELLSPKSKQTSSTINFESEILIDFRITENLIKQIQLFCENCFNDFQVKNYPLL